MAIEIEIRTLPDLALVTTDTLDICTPKTYELNVGDYRVIGTFGETGEKLQADFSVTQDQTTSIDLTFQPIPTPKGFVRIHAKLA